MSQGVDDAHLMDDDDNDEADQMDYDDNDGDGDDDGDDTNQLLLLDLRGPSSYFLGCSELVAGGSSLSSFLPCTSLGS